MNDLTNLYMQVQSWLEENFPGSFETVLATALGLTTAFLLWLGRNSIAASLGLAKKTTFQTDIHAPGELWFKRITNAGDEHFNSFLSVYEANRDAQEEWWDPAYMFAEWVESCNLYVAIRDDQVLAYVFFSYLDESRYAVIWYLGSVRGQERSIGYKLLSHVKRYVPKRCEAVLYECISTDSASAKKRPEALARTQLFLSIARQLGAQGEYPWYSLHLGVQYRMPHPPDEFAPQLIGPEKLLELYYLPLQSQQSEPVRWLPKEKVADILHWMYREYRLTYEGEQATKYGRPYADYVAGLEAELLDSLQGKDVVECRHVRHKLAGREGYAKSHADF